MLYLYGITLLNDTILFSYLYDLDGENCLLQPEEGREPDKRIYTPRIFVPYMICKKGDMLI